MPKVNRNGWLLLSSTSPKGRVDGRRMGAGQCDALQPGQRHLQNLHGIVPAARTFIKSALARDSARAFRIGLKPPAQRIVAPARISYSFSGIGYTPPSNMPVIAK